MIWCAAEHTPLGGLAYRAIVGPAIALASSISAPVGFQIKIIKLRRRASYSNRSLKKKLELTEFYPDQIAPKRISNFSFPEKIPSDQHGRSTLPSRDRQYSWKIRQLFQENRRFPLRDRYFTSEIGSSVKEFGFESLHAELSRENESMWTNSNMK